jgi:hypothetical protein
MRDTTIAGEAVDPWPVPLAGQAVEAVVAVIRGVRPFRTWGRRLGVEVGDILDVDENLVGEILLLPQIRRQSRATGE